MTRQQRRATRNHATARHTRRHESRGRHHTHRPRHRQLGQGVPRHHAGPVSSASAMGTLWACAACRRGWARRSPSDERFSGRRYGAGPGHRRRKPERLYLSARDVQGCCDRGEHCGGRRARRMESGEGDGVRGTSARGTRPCGRAGDECCAAARSGTGEVELLSARVERGLAGRGVAPSSTEWGRDAVRGWRLGDVALGRAPWRPSTRRRCRGRMDDEAMVDGGGRWNEFESKARVAVEPDQMEWTGWKNWNGGGGRKESGRKEGMGGTWRVEGTVEWMGHTELPLEGSATPTVDLPPERVRSRTARAREVHPLDQEVEARAEDEPDSGCEPQLAAEAPEERESVAARRRTGTSHAGHCYRRDRRGGWGHRKARQLAEPDPTRATVANCLRRAFALVSGLPRWGLTH